MDAESCILQPDLFSRIIQDIIKLVEDWNAGWKAIVHFNQWYELIFTSDTLKQIESIVRGVTKIDALKYFVNKLVRGRDKENRTPEILINNQFFHEQRSIILL